MVRKVLNKYPKLDYIQKCIRSINNNQIVSDVLNIGRNPMILEFKTFGDRNKDKNIYVFKNLEGGGFFANYRNLLDALYFAERFSLVPVVKYTHDFAYYEEQEVNGTKNPFEYYYEQVSEISVEEAESSFNVVEYRKYHSRLAELINCHYYNANDIYINTMAQIAKKYIRLNQYVTPIINDDINNILQGKKTIGVHVRGTDFKLKLINHPVMVTLTDYIQYIDFVLAHHNFEQIFLATDENATVKFFKERFGDILVYYKDVFRTDGIISPATINSDREYHKYLVGLEVLRDMITLANCDGLIAGPSSVSACARITRVSYDKTYEYLKIIYKGIYNKYYWRSYFIKKYLKYRRKRIRYNYKNQTVIKK